MIPTEMTSEFLTKEAKNPGWRFGHTQVRATVQVRAVPGDVPGPVSLVE